MYLDSEKKKEIFGTYGKSNTDTGSPEAQIALLKMLVGKRRKLLDYLMRVDINRYRELIAKKELGIRK